MKHGCGVLGNDTDNENLKYAELNISQFHFVHHKSHMVWPDIEFGPQQ
jgi:hypothetical protein